MDIIYQPIDTMKPKQNSDYVAKSSLNLTIEGNVLVLSGYNDIPWLNINCGDSVRFVSDGALGGFSVTVTATQSCILEGIRFG
jgi:hypothetical protein